MEESDIKINKYSSMMSVVLEVCAAQCSLSTQGEKPEGIKNHPRCYMGLLLEKE